MALNFPNASRGYDATRHSVRFWGYDSTFEVPFYVGDDALRLIGARPEQDEAELLRVFDANRPRIEQAAAKAYGRKKQSSYHLSPTDF